MGHHYGVNDCRYNRPHCTFPHSQTFIILQTSFLNPHFDTHTRSKLIHKPLFSNTCSQAPFPKLCCPSPLWQCCRRLSQSSCCFSDCLIAFPAQTSSAIRSPFPRYTLPPSQHHPELSLVFSTYGSVQCEYTMFFPSPTSLFCNRFRS